MSDFTMRDWQNGKYCPQHDIPYCTPCFKLFTQRHEDDDRNGQDFLNRLRAKAIRRIRDNSEQQWYRPRRRNFAEDSRQQGYAMACQLGENYVVVPLAFILVGDDHRVYKAGDAEMREILTREHQWDISTPEWARYDVPDFSTEDTMFLREMQLFK